MNINIVKILFISLPIICFSANAFIDENVDTALTKKTANDIHLTADAKVDAINENHQVINVININQASADKLVTLKGVGIKKALAIVEYREANGNFTQIKELLKVKGIGEQVIKDNKMRISI